MKGLLPLLAVFAFLPAFADQNEPECGNKEGQSFKSIEVVLELPALAVKDQYKTSTCWSFSGVSLLEAEILRMGKQEVDLSEMFVVRRTYERKADRFIRMHGTINFSPGGEANDVTDVVSSYGIVPESVYSGLMPDKESHVHSDMDLALEEYVESLVQNPENELSEDWQVSYNEVLDNYLGELPNEFVYNGESYTAKSFAEYLGLDPQNYIMITSFSHQPFYKPFILEVPDNWSWGYTYNVPLNELEQIADSALMNGFTIAWASDASEDGFSFTEGMAIAPEIVYSRNSERKLEKWKKKSKDERLKIIFDESKPLVELKVDQYIRQEAFDNYSTTDDHGMHIVGLASDFSGKKYYYIKNSWGDDNIYNGYIYVSKAYFRFKTISIMLHKDAIPEEIASKLML